MDDGVTAFSCCPQTVAVSDIALDRTYAIRFEVCCRPALECDDFVSLVCELAANGASEKSAAACDQDSQRLTLHFLCRPAGQFLAPDLGVVPDIHREPRVEQHGADFPRDRVCLGKLQQVEMHTLGIDR